MDYTSIIKKTCHTSIWLNISIPKISDQFHVKFFCCALISTKLIKPKCVLSVSSLIFQNETVGEFWYTLSLTAEPPSPAVLPHMDCELGKWSRQFITLSNPTEETLELSPSCSNTNNFTLEVEGETKVSS